MKHQRLRERIRHEPVPGEHESEQRAWKVVRAAYEERTPIPRRRHGARLALALAGAMLLLALLLSPAGAAVRDWIGDVIDPGKERAAPALTRLPSPGQLLVESEGGAWIVQENGSSRSLGAYEEATWSPSGMFVAVTAGRQLTAVVGDAAATGQQVGTVRWSKSEAQPVHDVVWAPTGFRIAYLSGHELRVVAGDGSDPALVAETVSPVTPAWRPLTRSQQERLVKTGGLGTHVLAYVDAQQRVRVVDTDSRRERWQTEPFDSPIQTIGWSPNGETLFVLTERELSVLVDRLDGEPFGGTHALGPSTGVLAASSPRTGEIAVVLKRTQPSGETRSKVLLFRGGSRRLVFANPGRFTDLTWSPNGRWLLVAWDEADQWLFVRPRTGKVHPVGNITRQFAPGDPGSAAFPGVAGWCCAR
jgi:hypothetical protein